MPFPTAGVTGQFFEQDGSTPATGQVLFDLSVPLRDPDTDEIVAPVTTKTTLDGTGSISATLATKAVTGAYYNVTELIAGAPRRSYTILLPASGTVDLSDVEAALGVIPSLQIELDDLSDVATSSPTDGYVLAYDEVTETWIPTLVSDVIGDAHVNDTIDAHDASAISVTPTGGLASTDVQAALAELDSEKSSTSHDHDATYVNEVDHTLAAHDTLGLATQVELDGEATTRSAADTALDGRLDTLEAISFATDAELAAHEADTTNVHGIADTSVLETTTGAQTKVDAHVNDAVDAHDAAAVSVDPTGLTHVTGTDVQTAIEELDAAAGGGGSGGHTVKDAGTPLAQRAGLNFGAGFDVADDLANDETDVDVDFGTGAGQVAEGNHTHADLATDAELTAHLDDAADAHDASAISYAGSTNLSATDVEAALDELDSEKASTSHAHTEFVEADPTGLKVTVSDTEPVAPAVDDVWFDTATASEGLDLPLLVRKTGDTSRASTTTRTADPDLVVAVDANDIVRIEYDVYYEGAAAGFVSFELTGPTGAAGRWAATGLYTGATTSDETTHRTRSISIGGGGMGFGAIGAGSVVHVRISALIRNGATAGNVELKWAQGASNATATIVKTDSHLVYQKVQ